MKTIKLTERYVEGLSSVSKKVILGLEGIYSLEARVGESCKYTTDGLRKRMKEDDMFDYISVEDNKIVGFLIGHIDANALFIEWIGVDNDNRKVGVMSSLLSDIEKICLEKGVNRIWCDTNQKNEPAIGFFRKNGFNVFGTITNFWFGHDYYFWEKQLNNN
jgi:ribosomal protein S18 acetylase RimI-like enzyme